MMTINSNPLLPGILIKDSTKYDSLIATFFRLYKKPNTIRNPSPNPVSISRESLSSMNPNEYGISEKTDGVRYNLLLCRDNEGKPTSCMIDRACKLYQVDVSCEIEYFEGSLFDGELVWERVKDKDKNRLVWFAFDVISCCGRNMINENYLSRIECINNCFLDPIEGITLVGESLRKRLLELSTMKKIASSGEPFDLIFKPKTFVLCSNIEYLWNSIPSLPHDNDGLIFIPLNDSIQTGTHWRQYKWKYEHTVDLQLRARRDKSKPDGWVFGLYYLEADFTVSKADSKDREREAEEEGVPKYLNACTGIEFEGRMVYFILEINKLMVDLLCKKESKNQFKIIIEFVGRFDQPNRFICTAKKIRPDKSEPNNRYTVRQTLLNIQERITIEEIKQHILMDKTTIENSYLPSSPIHS